MGDCAKNLQNKRDWFYGLCSATYTGNTGIITTTFKRNSNCTISCLWWQSWQNFHQTREKSISAISVASIIFDPSPSLRRFCILLFKLSWQQRHWLHVNCHSIHSTRTWWVRLHICMIQYSQHGNVLRLTYILYMENAFMWGSFWITAVTVDRLQSDCI